jgi:hypothetical protein
MSTTTQRLCSLLVATLFIIVLALMATFGVGSAAQAESDTVVDREPISFAIVNPCNGELIPITGHETTVFHFTNNDHTQAVVSQYSLQASGVGEITGARYQVNNTSHVTITVHTGNTATFTNHANYIGEGQVPDFMQHGLEHFTLTPDGMSVHFSNSSEECKG